MTALENLILGNEAFEGNGGGFFSRNKPLRPSTSNTSAKTIRMNVFCTRVLRGEVQDHRKGLGLAHLGFRVCDACPLGTVGLISGFD
jgi:hypothetical protein